jgi:hypothetical protein
MTGKRIVMCVAALLLLAALAAGVAARGGRAEPAAAGQPAPPAPACDVTIARLYPQFGTAGALAWASHQVVAGTVVEQLPPRWVEADPRGRPPGSRPTDRLIYTDYVVRVEGRFRGAAAATVRVRQLGGARDGCVTRNESEPPLVPGVRRLLFLGLPQGASAELSYAMMGGPQGQWRVEGDGTVRTEAAHLRGYDGRPLAQVGAEVLAALADRQLALPGPDLVPLEEAPAVPAP